MNMYFESRFRYFSGSDIFSMYIRQCATDTVSVSVSADISVSVSLSVSADTDFYIGS